MNEPLKYGIIAEGSVINASIYRCFEYITEVDAAKFVKKFRQLPHDENQVMHTFRELVIGAYLASKAIMVRSDPEIEGKTPDWSADGSTILEVTTLHGPQGLEDSIQRQLDEKGVASYWAPDCIQRLAGCINKKAESYAAIIGDRPYVVAVFPEIVVEVDDDDMRECLEGRYNLFGTHPHLSGVVRFIERCGVYHFRYFANPLATKPFSFPEGSLDLRKRSSSKDSYE